MCLQDVSMLIFHPARVLLTNDTANLLSAFFLTGRVANLLIDSQAFLTEDIADPLLVSLLTDEPANLFTETLLTKERANPLTGSQAFLTQNIADLLSACLARQWDCRPVDRMRVRDDLPKAAEVYQPLQMSQLNTILDIIDDPYNFQNHATTCICKTTPTSATDHEVIENSQRPRLISEILRPSAYLVDSIPWLKYLGIAKT
ncbi:hypothetical protein DFH29DRAFT_872891 [Suillus ampliporus]|nr:hypothetical protein DFH29DRAFT_872891 [Suillus ampliporus]